MKAIWNLGFRPFFLGGLIYGLMATLIWTLFYTKGWHFFEVGIFTPAQHGHEMVYGYGLAIVAGFLMTAVQNWTGVPSINGIRLAFVFAIWVLARLTFLLQTFIPLEVVALFDLSFNLLVIVAVMSPILKVKQWRQMGISFKLMSFFVLNVFYYAEQFSMMTWGVYWSNYFGVYLLIGLFLTIGRRVIPFFISRGVGYPVELKNSVWIDRTSLFGFVIFALADLVTPNGMVATCFALVLFIVHILRAIGWHTVGIWHKPLLWSLYLAYLFVVFGFLLKVLVPFGMAPHLALHMFTVGGIAVGTLSMIARVSLGHTGRNIHQPPKILVLVFVAIIGSVLTRVLLPSIQPEHYVLWIGITQILWTISFLLLIVVYFPILSRPRIDGMPG